MNRIAYIIILILLLIISVAAGIFVGSNYYLDDSIPKNSYIGKINVGGMTRREAISAISTFEPDDILENPLAFVYEENIKITKFEFWPSQAGMQILPEDTIDQIFSGNRSYFFKVSARIVSKKREFPPKFKISDPAETFLMLEEVKEYISKKPSDAEFIVLFMKTSGKSERRVIIQDEVIGKKLLEERSFEEFDKNIRKGIMESKLIVEDIKPKITNAMLLQIPNADVIGSYTTYYGTHDSPNRIHNIFLVSSFVNNTYLGTVESFSLLKPVGEFTPERGFKEAYVIIGDELVPEYGGGTCQIATTLYNAVMNADLEVLSRANHGIYFSIYPLGRDATVYPPYTDFRFRNNTGYPIVIQAVPFKKGLTFRVIGHPTGKKVRFSYPKVEYKYATVLTKDAETGQEHRAKIKTDAFRTEVTRTVSINGKTVKKEKIKSSYKLHGDKADVKIRKKEPR
ncbi:MAG: VanW family protein [Candidatus Margulisiibacteriota bacterium]